MMGRSHALCGLTYGATVAAALDGAPASVRLLAIPVAGGAALLPDIDTPSSRVSRSLGPITQIISIGVAMLSVFVYEATRGPRDSRYSNGGHRRLTHCVLGCLLFGAIALVAVLVHPVAATAVLALLVGLLAQGFRAIGYGFTIAGAVLAWNVTSQHTAWWWVWPVLIAGGAFVHILGDTVTNSGTPILALLLTRDGMRWVTIRTPWTFSTGQVFEQLVVTPVLWAGFAVSLTFATGLAQHLISTAIAS
jgi:membrane-bound metal-dependent hydrolase YbcI (DUF457 family)